jgi:predicted acetyltransferase
MNTIKKIALKDMKTWVDIICNAYPGMKVVGDKEKQGVKQRLWKLEKGSPDINMYGLYRKGQLLGGMRLFDFSMTMYSIPLPVGGLGLVAVDLAHKKEHVCKELVDYFIDYYAKKKYTMLALYAFRPDFYRKMGFGYGTKINQYRIKPADLPRGKLRKNVGYASRRDVKALRDCYHRFVARTHGMMKRTTSYKGPFYKPEIKAVVYRNKGRIEGFLVFEFKTSSDENWLAVEIHISEFIYENRDALAGLLAFLHSQADQVHCIQYATHDEFLHFLPADPRTDSNRLISPVGHESNAQGVGIMYRIVDTTGLFRKLKNHDFNGQNCKLKITVHDSLYPKHDGSYVIDFVDGRARVKTGGECDVEISLDVADYSSMVMGVVPFDRLYEYGLAEISNKKYVDTVTKLFTVDKKPMCITQF